MSKQVLAIVVLSLFTICTIAAFLGSKVGRWSRDERVKREEPIHVSSARSPKPAVQAKHVTHPGRQNLAVLATVSVSSNEETDQPARVVADDVLDGREWVTRGEAAGAWIKLTWQHPVTVTEIELYDLVNPRDNVQRGTLSFDDGTTIPVPALPPDGSPWHINLPPKTIQWVMFRIDGVEGTRTGLAEFVIVGTPN